MTSVEEIQTVEQVLIDYQTSYNQRDAHAFLSLFDGANPQMMLWGHRKGDVHFGLHEIARQIKREWEKSDALKFTDYKIIAMDVQGDYAVTAAEWFYLARAGSESAEFPLRSTFVLKLIGKRWLVQHAHWSFPSNNLDE